MQDIKQHKSHTNLDDDDNDDTIDTPCLTVQNLDKAFNNGSDEIPSPQDPPETDISLLEFKSSPPHPLQLKPWYPSDQTLVNPQLPLRKNNRSPMADPSEEPQKVGRAPLVPQNPSQCNKTTDRAIGVVTAGIKETHGPKNIMTDPSTPQPKASNQADLGQQPLLTHMTMFATDLESLVVDTKPALLGNQGFHNSSPTAASPFKIDWGVSQNSTTEWMESIYLDREILIEKDNNKEST